MKRGIPDFFMFWNVLADEALLTPIEPRQRILLPIICRK
uniref:Uncharacterized protein n=1 Tax=Arundo donax TaxID=35708 RepID=A0A0A9C615_ARUDO